MQEAIYNRHWFDPGLGRSPGGGHSLIPVLLPGESRGPRSLENPMDIGDWRATVHMVIKSWT